MSGLGLSAGHSLASHSLFELSMARWKGRWPEAVEWRIIFGVLAFPASCETRTLGLREDDVV